MLSLGVPTLKKSFYSSKFKNQSQPPTTVNIWIINNFGYQMVDFSWNWPSQYQKFFGRHLVTILKLDKIVPFLNGHSKNRTGNRMAIKFLVQFRPYYSYKLTIWKRNHLKIGTKTSGSSNAPDFGFLYSDVDYIQHFVSTKKLTTNDRLNKNGSE
jgi:hypothetical protein